MIAALGLLAALGTVLARNLVHAALFLVAFFFTIACQFVLLEAEFLAAIQVLVYIGAVAIILMFGIMLTRNIQGDDTTIVRLPGRFRPWWPGSVSSAILVFGINNAVGSGRSQSLVGSNCGRRSRQTPARARRRQYGARPSTTWPGQSATS